MDYAPLVISSKEESEKTENNGEDEQQTNKVSKGFQCPKRCLEELVFKCRSSHVENASATTWQPADGFSMKDVSEKCQENFENIISRAMELELIISKLLEDMVVVKFNMGQH